MKRNIKILYCFILFLSTFSCTVKLNPENETSTFDLDDTLKTDTLKFTSGIRSILQDSKGNYWFGSQEEGVALYTGNSFTYYTNQDGLLDNQIHSIQEDKNGTVWLNTQHGVSRYRGVDSNELSTTDNVNSLAFFSVSINEPKPAEWTKTSQDMWFEAGIREGVIRYDGKKMSFLDFPYQNDSNPYNNLFATTSLSKGKNNMIWIGAYAGVFGYNGTDFTIINDATLGLKGDNETLHIRSLLEDSQGRLWIGNNGIGVLLRERDSTINFSEKTNLTQSASTKNNEWSPPGTMEHVFSISEDSQGNIWFGDRDTGIWKYDGENMVNYTIKDGSINDFALTIYEDQDKKLWFGMTDGKVYLFNGESFEKKF